MKISDDTVNEQMFGVFISTIIRKFPNYGQFTVISNSKASYKKEIRRIQNFQSRPRDSKYT